MEREQKKLMLVPFSPATMQRKFFCFLLQDDLKNDFLLSILDSCDLTTFWAKSETEVLT